MSLVANLREMECTREAYWLRHASTSPIKLHSRALTVRHCFHVLPAAQARGHRRFVASHSRFVVDGRYRAWDWLTSELQATGAHTRVMARNPDNGAPLIDVRRP
jgi:hypothetical protein